MPYKWVRFLAWLALFLLIPAGVVFLLLGTASAFLAPQNLPPEHPRVREATRRSNVFTVLSVASLSVATVAAIALRAMYRKERPVPHGGAVQHLQWSLQALAQPAEIQHGLFPDFVVVPDELALDFDNWCDAALPQLSASAVQRDALAAIHSALDRIGRDNTGIRTDPRWEEIRHLARAALAAFGWPADVPPADRSIYIRS